jgi:hypothetical protein
VRAGIPHNRPVLGGGEPLTDCTPSDPLTCGFDGTCDGAGACAHYPNGTRCGVGAACESGSCTAIAQASCDGDHTLTGVDGKKIDCAPFACTSLGACASRCTSADDCAHGYRCDANGACAPPTTTTIDDGCGCVIVGGRASHRLAESAAALAIAAVLLRRRRRAC